ncbi:hypothetical protein QBC37DRAFT_277104 [Rhypophila decipiens]|uniref:Uncharacterized protein n=1 Tax=Rhypophila decipiens TaxID=261697 RepID=A0AAN6YFC7_9PEZI|nr:hypothetical protein QBC37DRAFT_277104 [Rhypophila decipiens]
MRAANFWRHEAYKGAEARDLAESIGLDLPTGILHDFKSGIKYPMRRLVVTGKDTPDNLRLLFGVEEIPAIHAETRKEVLMAAMVTEGSPMAIMTGIYDKGCPRWSPRPASGEEKIEVEKQKDFTTRFSSLLRE